MDGSAYSNAVELAMGDMFCVTPFGTTLVFNHHGGSNSAGGHAPASDVFNPRRDVQTLLGSTFGRVLEFLTPF